MKNFLEKTIDFIKKFVRKKQFQIIAFSILLAFVVETLRRVLVHFPEFVERYYSMGFYRFLSQTMSILFGMFPFSVAEALIASLIIFSIYYLVRSIKRKRMLNFIAFAVCTVCVLYSSFFVFWGFNWSRVSTQDYLGLEIGPSHIDELRALSNEIADRINQIRPLLQEDKNGVMRINSSDWNLRNRAQLGFDNLARELDSERFWGIYSPPKNLISSRLFSYFRVVGIFIPYTFEANINRLDPDVSRPFTIMHEIAHQQGIAPEDEANFIAFLACRAHPDIDFIYSGYYMAFIYTMNELHIHDREEYDRIRERMYEGFRRDVIARYEFWEHFRNRRIFNINIGEIAGNIGEAVNDAYLQSQGVDDGIRSYSRMVSLLLAERRART